MKGYIYLIENKINHHKYIGKTYLTIEQRWKQHCKDSKRKEFQHRPLYRALNKYGINNFSIQEIEYTENCEDREKYWIAYYNTYHDGYNATLGGDGTLYFEYTDEEVINKYSELLNVQETANFFHCDTFEFDQSLYLRQLSKKQWQPHITMVSLQKNGNPAKKWQPRQDSNLN